MIPVMRSTASLFALMAATACATSPSQPHPSAKAPAAPVPVVRTTYVQPPVNDPVERAPANTAPRDIDREDARAAQLSQNVVLNTIMLPDPANFIGSRLVYPFSEDVPYRIYA